jgi:hypothetical protein
MAAYRKRAPNHQAEAENPYNKASMTTGYNNSYYESTTYSQ